MSFSVNKTKHTHAQKTHEGTHPTSFYGKIILISKFNKDSKRNVNCNPIHSYTDAKNILSRAPTSHSQGLLALELF